MRYSVFEYFHQTHGGCVSLCTSTNTRRSLERETHDGEKSKQCEEKHAKTGGEKTTDEDGCKENQRHRPAVRKTASEDEIAYERNSRTRPAVQHHNSLVAGWVKRQRDGGDQAEREEDG
ncbi:hypothetical protein ACOSP7_004838 [Xanthoceras sorbifolium]